MGHAGHLAVLATAAAFCLGSGLVRRDRRAAGCTLVAGAVVGALFLAVLGSWQPILYLIFLAGFFTGLEIDRPDSPSRRALALTAVGAGFFALIVAGVYA